MDTQKKAAILCFLLFLFSNPATGQENGLNRFLAPADTFSKPRFWTSAGAGIGIYTGVSIGLWNTWYKNYPLTKFHTFDDAGEWLQMDKSGHLFTAYFESRYIFNGAVWTGMDRNKAKWMGFGVGNLLQLTVETMDGFSEKWGFSLGDVGFNLLGSGLFLAQESVWQEQRIFMKASTDYFYKYPDYQAVSLDGSKTYSLDQRAADLYGTSFAESFLKEYNRLAIWASFNVWSFLPNRENSRFPKWLNVAVGYSGENLFGGFRNEWETDSGAKFVLNENQFPRYRQFLLSLDVDLSRLKTKSRFLNTVFDCFNWLKISAPTLEINSRGQVKFHPFY